MAVTYFPVTGNYSAFATGSILSGQVLFTPVFHTGDVAKGTGLTPPTGFVPVSIPAKLVNGVLQNLDGSTPVLLQANTADLNLTVPMYYAVSFEMLTATQQHPTLSGITISQTGFEIANFAFLAPTDASPVNLIQVTPAPGTTTVTGALQIPASGISDANAFTRLFLTSVTSQATALAYLGAGSGSGGAEWEEYANLAAFPATGDPAKEYVAQDTGKIYRWTGSTYFTTALTKADVGLGNVDNVSQATILANAATAAASASKSADTLVDGSTNGVFTLAARTRLANTSGTNTGDQTLVGLLPSQSGQSGKVLGTDGTNATWVANGSGGTTDATKIPLSTVTTKGDLIVATGAGAVTRQAVGSDGQVLTADSTQADGVKWATPSGGGTSLPPYFQMIGAQPADSVVTITHGLNTPNVFPVFERSYLPNGLTSAVPGQVVQFGWARAGLNAITVNMSDACNANEFMVTVNQFAATGIDVTGGTAGTLAASNPSLTTVDLTITGGVDVGVGNAGVNWFRGGTPVGTTQTDTFTDSGLTPTTGYTWTAQRFDFRGVLGALSNAASMSTLTPANVAAIGTAVQNRNAGGGSTSVLPSYATGNLRIAVAAVSVSHSEWFSAVSYNVAVNGTQSGGWTRLPEPTPPDVAFGTQYSGSVHIFYKLQPSLAWTTDTVTVTFTSGTSTITPVNAMISVQQYANVDQTTPFGTMVVNAPGSNSVPTASVVSNAGDFTMAVLGYANAAPTGYNRTLIGAIQGGSTSGYANFLLHGHVATASNGTITHSVTSSDVHALIAANIRKAGS